MPESYPHQQSPDNHFAPFAGAREGYRKHRLIGNLVLAAGLYATANSGGIADHVADPFQNAGHVTASALYDKAEVPLEQQTIDGIPFKQYPKKAQREFKAEAAAEDSADDRIVRTMSDLDGHRYGAIKERADAFRARHEADILPEAQKDEYIKRLESSESNDEVIGALDDFMGFYGKQARFTSSDSGRATKFNPSTPVHETRAAAEGVVNAYWYLPKKFIADADFDDVRITEGMGLAQGDYDGNERSIYMPITSNLKSVLLKAGNAFPNWAQDETSVRRNALHELGHAKQPSMSYKQPELSGGLIMKQLAEDLIGRPGEVSHYATASEDEANAEDFAVAFDTQKGPASPDETRRFGSAANKQVLRTYQMSEEQFPGITDYLIDMHHAQS